MTDITRLQQQWLEYLQTRSGSKPRVVNRGNLIGCVKLIRECTGLGLSEARNYMNRAKQRI